MNEKDVTNVSAKFPTELERRARVAAAQHGWSRSHLLRRAVEEYLRQLELEPNDKHEITPPSLKTELS